MKDINSIDFSDFSFGGKLLSSFDAEVGKSGGNFAFSLAPQIEIKSEDTAIGLDGKIVYATSYEPRTFSVPIILNDLTKIRDIAVWLSSKTEKPFFWKNDTVKINCMINNLNDLERSGLTIGTTEIKFIAHNPYFTLITETPTVFTTGFASLTLTNQGNVESYPILKIEGSGDVTVKINGQSFTVKSVSTYATVDGLYMTCSKGTTNKISDFAGDFPVLDAGTNTIVVTSTGTITKLTVTPRSRWI